MATSYRYCAACRSLWHVDAPNACPTCESPGRTDTIATAHCFSCDFAWHPAITLRCEFCHQPGLYAPKIRDWERLPQVATIVHSGVFPATTPV